MNDDWYKEGGWYKPLNQAEAPEAEEKAAAKKPFYKRSNFYLIICALLLLTCVILLAVTIGSRSTASVIPGIDDLPNFIFDGEMPDDFHDYLNNYYKGVTGTRSPVYLPQLKDRGSMNLAIAGGGESKTLSLQELYDKCTPSVVYIKAKQQDGKAYSWGTGIIVSSDGYIITNTHVISECVSAKIGLTSGKTYEAKLVGADSVSDIAILKINATGLTPAVFAASDTVSIGDAAIAIGNPLGEAYRLTMTNGIISAKDRSVNYNGAVMNLLQTNAAINEGNSGGPLFNDRGQVIGITNMKIISAMTGVEGIGFAIPTDTIMGIVNSIMADGAVYGRSTIGITSGAIPEAAAKHYNIPQGLYISNVEPDSDAAKQGVKAGDILIAIDGKEVSTTGDVAEIKNSHEIGDTMHFTIWRNGKTVDIDVMLMDANDIYN